MFRDLKKIILGGKYVCC